MNLREFLIQQAKRAGISPEDQDFNLFISASSLSEMEVPEDVHRKFNNNLFDIEIAKSNQELKRHFVRQYTSGYDEEIVKLSKEYGLTLDEVREIEDAKNSGDKVKLAMKYLKDLEEKAKKTASKGQSDEYVARLAEAQKKLDDAISKAESDKQAVANTYIEKMQSLYEQAHLSKVAWNDNIPEIARIPSYNAAKAEKLKSLNGVAIFDPEQNEYKLRNSNDPSLALVVNGKEFSYSDLSALILQENKLLRESGSSGGQTLRTGTNLNSGSPVNTGANTGTMSADVKSALAYIDQMAINVSNF
jgi:uncharacterized protein YdcH (DUF465 family)